MAKAKPIRLGIVGLGRAGIGMHCTELKGRERKFQIVAACDPIRERRDLMAERYGCATYRRIEDLLADPDVEMADIASRSKDHLAHALLALKSGKHVFLEKPICLTYAGAKKLKAAAKRAKGRLFVRHNRRWEPAFHHVQEIIASGVLGDVFEIKLRRGGYQRRDDWQTLKRYGGGQLLNWGPHIIDHALQMLGAPLESVWSNLKRIAALGDAEDHLKIVLTGRNGRVVDVEISGGAALPEPLYLVNGSRGALRVDGDQITLRYLHPRVKEAPNRASAATPDFMGGFGGAGKLRWVEKTMPVAPKRKTDTAMIWDALYDAVRKRRKFPVTLDEAVEVMKVVSRARAGTRFDVRERIP